MAPKPRTPDLAYALPQWWCTTWQKIDTASQPAQRRYYRLCLQQDLWGQWEVLRSWGRIGQSPTRVVQEPVDSPEVAQSIRAAVHKTRQRHGYQMQDRAEDLRFTGGQASVRATSVMRESVRHPE